MQDLAVAGGRAELCAGFSPKEQQDWGGEEDFMFRDAPESCCWPRGIPTFYGGTSHSALESSSWFLEAPPGGAWGYLSGPQISFCVLSLGLKQWCSTWQVSGVPSGVLRIEPGSVPFPRYCLSRPRILNSWSYELTPSNFQWLVLFHVVQGPHLAVLLEPEEAQGIELGAALSTAAPPLL